MLDQVIGSKTAAIALLNIVHFGEAYASGIAKDSQISLSQIQRQLDRFEEAGVLISKKIGNTRVYQFNLKSPFAGAFKSFVLLIYNSLGVAQRASLFPTRRRPRRKGKPVIQGVVKNK